MATRSLAAPPIGITGGGISIDSNATNGTIDQHADRGQRDLGRAGARAQSRRRGLRPESWSTAGSDVISNTQIINNVIRANVAAPAGIDLTGGNTTSSPPSRVSAVTIENDTFVNEQTRVSLPRSRTDPARAATRSPTSSSATRSSTSRPATRRSPRWAGANQPPDVVTNSLISGPGWAGQNGNINGNPEFVDEPRGDYHLAPASPAINAGTTIGAPSYDLDGARRDAQPDIGAFEYGAIPRPLLTVTAAAARRERDGHEQPGRHQLRNRMQRPLRPQHHRHAHRKTRQRVAIPRLAARMLRQSPLHDQTQQRQIGHGSLRALGPKADKRRTPPTRLPRPLQPKTCNRPESRLIRDRTPALPCAEGVPRGRFRPSASVRASVGGAPAANERREPPAAGYNLT